MRSCKVATLARVSELWWESWTVDKLRAALGIQLWV